MKTKQQVYLLWYTPSHIYTFGCSSELIGVFSSVESAKVASNIPNTRTWVLNVEYELSIDVDPYYIPSNAKGSLKSAKFKIEYTTVDCRLPCRS